VVLHEASTPLVELHMSRQRIVTINMSVAKRLDIAVACHSLEERGYGIQDLIQSQSGRRRLKMTTSHQHLPPTQTPSSINRRCT